MELTTLFALLYLAVSVLLLAGLGCASNALIIAGCVAFCLLLCGVFYALSKQNEEV